jgi:hypothetical protein
MDEPFLRPWQPFTELGLIYWYVKLPVPVPDPVDIKKGRTISAACTTNISNVSALSSRHFRILFCTLTQNA